VRRRAGALFATPQPRQLSRLVVSEVQGAALTACAATTGRHPTRGEDRADRSLDRLQSFTNSGRFLLLVRAIWPEHCESAKRGDAVGGAVTPPTAFQSVSEQPHEPGSNGPREPPCRSAYTVSCRSSVRMLTDRVRGRKGEVCNFRRPFLTGVRAGRRLKGRRTDARWDRGVQLPSA
jgi:hypothetical protein